MIETSVSCGMAMIGIALAEAAIGNRPIVIAFAATAILAALPLVRVLVLIWLHVEGQSVEKILEHA
jgi:hypothetical protein